MTRSCFFAIPGNWVPPLPGGMTGKRDNIITMKEPTVYILASRRNGTLYVGVTSDPIRRIWEHRNDILAGFTRKYQVHRLVYFEQYQNMPSAIAREKQLKNWPRSWKLALLEKDNPEWKDLWADLISRASVY